MGFFKKLFGKGAGSDASQMFEALLKLGDTPETVKELLEEHPGLVSRATLGVAVLGNMPNLARALIKKWKIDVNAKDESGSTALHMAATFGRASMAEQLLNWGARVDVRDGEGKTPLEIAEDMAEMFAGLSSSSAAILSLGRQFKPGSAQDYHRVVGMLRRRA